MKLAFSPLSLAVVYALAPWSTQGLLSFVYPLSPECLSATTISDEKLAQSECSHARATYVYTVTPTP
jgi:hypothetical protein